MRVVEIQNEADAVQVSAMVGRDVAEVNLRGWAAVVPKSARVVTEGLRQAGLSVVEGRSGDVAVGTVSQIWSAARSLADPPDSAQHSRSAKPSQPRRRRCAPPRPTTLPDAVPRSRPARSSERPPPTPADSPQPRHARPWRSPAPHPPHSESPPPSSAPTPVRDPGTQYATPRANSGPQRPSVTHVPDLKRYRSARLHTGGTLARRVAYCVPESRASVV